MSSSEGASSGRCASRYATAIAYGAARPIARVDVELDGTESETFIQAPHPISPRIDGDLLVSDRAQLDDDAGAALRLGRARQFVRSHLYARHPLRLAIGIVPCVMMPH